MIIWKERFQLILKGGLLVLRAVCVGPGLPLCSPPISATPDFTQRLRLMKEIRYEGVWRLGSCCGLFWTANYGPPFPTWAPVSNVGMISENLFNHSGFREHNKITFFLFSDSLNLTDSQDKTKYSCDREVTWSYRCLRQSLLLKEKVKCLKIQRQIYLKYSYECGANLSP